MNPDLNECIALCYRCAAACDHCVAACLRQTDAEEMSDCISLNQQCAALCRVTAQLLASQSELSEQLCTINSMACQLAGWASQKYQHDHCQRSAELSLQCAEMCMEIGMDA